MSDSSDDYTVGYKRPPKAAQWQKGQSGNSQGRRPKPRESAIEMIDRLLLEPVQIILNGKSMRVPAIQAIVIQLQKKQAGNSKAGRVLLKYRELAHQTGNKRLEIVFVENDYTKALSRDPNVKGGGHE